VLLLHGIVDVSHEWRTAPAEKVSHWFNTKVCKGLEVNLCRTTLLAISSDLIFLLKEDGLRSDGRFCGS
jgi:hypothetical protein